MNIKNRYDINFRYQQINYYTEYIRIDVGTIDGDVDIEIIIDKNFKIAFQIDSSATSFGYEGGCDCIDRFYFDSCDLIGYLLLAKEYFQ